MVVKSTAAKDIFNSPNFVPLILVDVPNVVHYVKGTKILLVVVQDDNSLVYNAPPVRVYYESNNQAKSLFIDPDSDLINNLPTNFIVVEGFLLIPQPQRRESFQRQLPSVGDRLLQSENDTPLTIPSSPQESEEKIVKCRVWVNLNVVDGSHGVKSSVASDGYLYRVIWSMPGLPEILLR